MAKLDVPEVQVLAEHNTPARMRDGTTLRADVYRRGGRPVPRPSSITLPVIPR